MDYDCQDIAKMIDHSLLNPVMTDDDLEKGCQIAVEYNVASACIKPYYLKRCSEILKGSTVKTSTTIGGAHIGLEISGNIIENNEKGIYLNCIRSLSIKKNNISLNSDIGVFIEGYFCKIIKNNIFNNELDAYNNAGFFHYWNNNFWGENVKIIKIIPGKFINLDWNPVNMPYDLL